MTIKELYNLVGNLPEMINVIDKDENHIFIGKVKEAKADILDLEVKSSYIHD